MQFNKTTVCMVALALSMLTGEASADKGVLFDIHNFRIEAAHDTGAALDVLSAYTGRQKNFRDVMGALDALKAYYAQVGMEVSINLPPEQDITSGEIRLRIVSAEDRKRLRNIDDSGRARAAFPSLKEGEPINLPVMRMSTELFNENPYRSSFVKYTPSNEGTDVQLIVRKNRDPSVFIASLDNSGVPSTGRERLTLSVQKLDLPGDAVAGATCIVSPQKPDAVNIFILRYKTPLYSQYSSVEVYAARSNSDAGVVADFFNVSGKGYVYGAKYNRYLPASSDSIVQQVSMGFEQRDYINSVTAPGSPLSLVPDYVLRPLTASYSIRKTGGWDVSASLTHGLYGGNLGLVRAGAVSGYNIFKANGEYLFPVAEGVSVTGFGSVQYTGDLLVSGEQFGVGGMTSVRGLNERELSGDNGARFSVEMSKSLVKNLLAAIFIDGARAWRNMPLPGEVSSSGATSVGVGVRYLWESKFSSSVDLAQILSGDGETKKGATRLLASLTYSF